MLLVGELMLGRRARLPMRIRSLSASSSCHRSRSRLDVSSSGPCTSKPVSARNVPSPVVYVFWHSLPQTCNFREETQIK